MKSSVWNILTILLLVGTIFLLVVFAVIFIAPGVLPDGLRPVTVPGSVIMPTATETPFLLPATWTKTALPKTATSTVTPSVTPSITESQFVIPSKTPTATASKTVTPSITNTKGSGVVIIVSGTPRTATKTKAPTKTKTPTKTRTPGGPADLDAIDDIATVSPYPASVTINPLGNDINNTGTAIHVNMIIKDPKYGTVQYLTPDKSVIKYSPREGFMGIDTFTYKMSTEGGLTDTAVVTIYVMDPSMSIPTDITYTPSINPVPEDTVIGTLIGAFDTTDPDGPFQYMLVSGAGSTDNKLFNINSTNGNIQTAAMFNFEAKPTLYIRVRSTDQTHLFVEKAFTISVGNSNEAPVFTSGDTLSGKVGTALTFSVRASDPDAGDTRTITAVNTLPDGLTLNTVSNGVSTITGIPTMAGTYVINLRVEDAGGLFDTLDVTVTIAP